MDDVFVLEHNSGKVELRRLRSILQVKEDPYPFSAELSITEPSITASTTFCLWAPNLVRFLEDLVNLDKELIGKAVLESESGSFQLAIEGAGGDCTMQGRFETEYTSSVYHFSFSMNQSYVHEPARVAKSMLAELEIALPEQALRHKKGTAS